MNDVRVIRKGLISLVCLFIYLFKAFFLFGLCAMFYFQLNLN